MTSQTLQAAIDRANASGRRPVVFIHGLWLLASSWKEWQQRFEAEGYATVAVNMRGSGTPIVASNVNRCSEIRLLSTPLPEIVPFFCALKAVASSLKCWTSVPGSGPSNRTLALPS